MSTQKILIYLRVSTLDQARDGYSLAAQRKALEAWANIQKYEIVQIYADSGISGKDIKHRPAMETMLKRIENNDISLVAVWSLSRLTRSVSDLYTLWQFFNKHKCGLVSYTETFDTSTPVGRAMMGLLGIFAQMEREITGERVRAAMTERAEQGKRTANEILGYDLEGKDSLKINEAEAEQIRFIYDSYLQLKNFSHVAKLCLAHGYRGKRGKTLTAEHIKRILTRPVYIGYNSYNGKTYTGRHTPIIKKETWERIQTTIEKSKRGETA